MGALPAELAAGAAGGAEEAEAADSMLRRGHVYRGIFCPSLSTSFLDLQLEQAYQRYSYRQRQKALIAVNLVDLAIKVMAAVVVTLPSRVI